MTSIYVVLLLASCILFNSPGDSIGFTGWDGSMHPHGQRLRLDDNNDIHVVWRSLGPGSYIGWNFRFPGGIWYGTVQAAPSASGRPQVDVTRDVNPDDQVTAIGYYYDPGSGYYSWIDTDAGQGWGIWPNNPVTPAIVDHIWPSFCFANNNNIVMASGDYTAGDTFIAITSTNNGVTWQVKAEIDSCPCLSYFMRSSSNIGSSRVICAWTQFIEDSTAGGQLDNDVWFMYSGDCGVTWSSPINLTNYQPYPIDSVRAYCDVNAVFDLNDNIHIAWSGRKVDTAYHAASKLFHWDEMHDTITIVNSPSIYYGEPGGWWIATTSSPSPGAWRMPVDEPQLVVDEITGALYCLWHGNDDYNDGSAAGYFNGEFYGSYSADTGLTWSNYVNLTNTRTPGAGPGECDDEDLMTANPFTRNDSIFITYIEDKDAGSYAQSEGVMTVNPVRCWIFHKDLISGVREAESVESVRSTPILEVFPNPFVKHTEIRCVIQDTRCRMDAYSLKIYDASGQLVKQFNRPTLITWQGDVPAGVYFVELVTEDCVFSEKVIKLK